MYILVIVRIYSILLINADSKARQLAPPSYPLDNHLKRECPYAELKNVCFCWVPELDSRLNDVILPVVYW